MLLEILHEINKKELAIVSLCETISVHPLKMEYYMLKFMTSEGRMAMVVINRVMGKQKNVIILHPPKKDYVIHNIFFSRYIEVNYC